MYMGMCYDPYRDDMNANYIVRKNYAKKNESFNFKFVGKEEKDIEYEIQIETLIDKYFKKIRTFQDIKKIILWLRTILKEYEEEFLCVETQSKNEEMKIIYREKKLVSFKIENYEENFSLSCEIAPGFYRSTRIKRKNFEKDYSTTFEDINNLIKSLEIYEVKEDPSEQYICAIYKLFYNENPNFASKEIDTKIQAMFYILQYFYIDMAYAFDKTLQNSAMPFSTKLQMDVERLTPFGKVEVSKEEIKISEFNKRRIETIGEMVQKETQGQIENLISFASTLYNEELEKRYKPTPDLETIAITTGIELEHIVDNLELARKIEKETDKIQK